ncbi:MAG: Ltp family lipoprotein [Candidatus Magasanikbacteria bacterium]
MQNLFGLLFLASFICLIIGLIKPTIFGKFIKGELTKKRVGKIFGISTVAFFILIGVTAETPKKTNEQTVQQPVVENTEVVEKNKNENSDSVVVEETQTDTTPTPAKKETKTTPEATPEPTPTPASVQVEQEIKDKTESVPAEYKSALNKATLYANTMNMSKKGVYDQLVSEYGEKFSVDATQYAIDNVKADWNVNALAKAKTYQDTMDMSPANIHDQLISEYGEQFTQSEADYAIEHLND